MDANPSEGEAQAATGPALSPRRRGRPRKVTPERVAKIEALRARGVRWEKIGRELGLNPETCRRAFWAVKRAQRTVGNPTEGFQKTVPKRPGWRERAFAIARAVRLLRREKNSELPPPRN
jgi:hypothetical protein